MKWGKMKSWGLLVLGVSLMIFNYSKQADNKRSPNHLYKNGKK